MSASLHTILTLEPTLPLIPHNGDSSASIHDLEDSLEELGELYSKAVEKFGDLAPEVAPIAFLYGVANLKMAVKMNNLRVSAEVRRKEREQAGEAGGEEEEQEVVVVDEAELQEVFEIAWESFEAARVVFERVEVECGEEEEKKQARERLAMCFSRLAELSMEQGQTEQSLGDYEKALQIRIKDEPATSRELAGVYFSTAIVLELLAMESGSVERRICAVNYFAKACATLAKNRDMIVEELLVAKPTSSSASSSVASFEALEMDNVKGKLAHARTWATSLSSEQVQVLDQAVYSCFKASTADYSVFQNQDVMDLSETLRDVATRVDDVSWNLTLDAQKERAQVTKEQAEASTTTIGFGSSGAAAAAATTMTSGDVAVAATPINIMQPKKKVKLETVAVVATSDATATTPETATTPLRTGATE